MTNGEVGGNRLQVRKGPLITGATLGAVGGAFILAGLVVGGAHLLMATRQWIQEMETPPSELARVKWAQAKTAALAGASAWKDGTAASNAPVS
jgi:hypothetical protein